MSTFYIFLSSPRAESTRGYWQMVPSQCGGGGLLNVQAGFLYENGPNSETKIQIVDSKVRNELSFQGLHADR